MYNQTKTDPSQGYQNQVAGSHWVLQFGQMGPKMKSGAKFEYEICLFHPVQHLILNIAEHELCMYMPHSQPQNFIGMFNVLSQWYQLKCFMWRVTAPRSRLQGNQACSRLPSRVFSVMNFRHLATHKKRAGESNKGNSEKLFLKSPYLEGKKARSRQIQTLCCCRSPELSRIPKKIYLSTRTVAIYC